MMSYVVDVELGALLVLAIVAMMVRTLSAG
jgi:hypothetical protein